MSLQINDIYWKFDIANNIYSTALKLLDVNNSSVSSIKLENYKFNFKLSNTRFCTGYYDLEGYHPCPFLNNITNANYEQCWHCEKKQGFKAAFFLKQKPNENMNVRLAKKHYIYLAFFAPDLIKVGTAVENRKFIRPVEQDALIYMYIAENDGFNIQKLERDISKQFKIPEFIRSSTKLKSISIKPDFAKAEKMLIGIFKKIATYYNDKEDFNGWLYKQDNLAIYNISNDRAIFYPEEFNIIDNKERNVLAGEYLGLRSKYLFFQNKELMMIDKKDIIGRRIEDYIENYSYSLKKLTEQISLI